MTVPACGDTFKRANRILAARYAIALAAMIMILAPDGRGLARAAEPMAGNNPYVKAARAAGVPLELLVAVAGAESGYHPWALDVAGRQVYCRSREEAERILATTDNVDVGLMQINWPFWGHRLGVSKDALLDPQANLVYGAQILRQGLNRGGSIWRRISNYHSGGVHERERYNQRVYMTYLRYLRGEIR